jgi:glycosyltransferase involved in cell wall biosynthesis
MKLLYHLPMPLTPVNTGAKQRILGTLKYLREKSESITVDVVGMNPYGEKVWDREQYSFLADYCRKVHIYQGSSKWTDWLYCKAQSVWHQKFLKVQMPIDSDYYSPIGYQKFVSHLLCDGQYDSIWINYLNFSSLAMVKQASGVLKVIDIHDISCRIRLACGNIPHLRGLKFDYEENFAREVKQLKRFDYVLVNSLTELAELRPHLEADKLLLIPHLLSEAPDIQKLPDYEMRHMKYDLLFVGAAYGPNVEGMQFFLRNIFPGVVKQFPFIKLAVAGNICSVLEIPANFKENIETLGFVDYLSDLYLSSKAVICPLLNGSGTKVKLQEAMSYGVPIVTTTVGASGLELKDGFNAYVRDGADEFMNAVIQIFQVDGQAASFSHDLLKTYNKSYSNSIIHRKLDAMYSTAVRN